MRLVDDEWLALLARLSTTDPDAATRYGNMVYVRCGPRA